MADIEIVKVPSHIVQSFTASYGKIGEHLDEDTWLSWFGIWSSAWAEAIQHTTQLTERLQNARKELEDAWIALETIAAHRNGGRKE